MAVAVLTRVGPAMASGAARYDYKHAVLGGTQVWAPTGRLVQRERRVSVIFRSSLTPK